MVSHRRCSRAALAAAAAGLALALLCAPGMAQSQTATSAAPAAASTESLPALLARVLPADPQVRSAAALAEAAQERRKQSQSRMWPTIGASITRGGAAETELGRSVNRQTDRAEATVRWNVYNAGNDAAELRAATLEVQAAQEELRRAREEASTRIAEAYLDLLRLDSLVPKALERLQAVQRLARQVRLQAEIGKLSNADASQAEASELDAEVVYQELVSDQAGARRRLATLVGAASVEALPGVVPLDLPPPALESPSAEMLLASGPGQVTAAQERARAAAERVRPLSSLAQPRIDVELRQRLWDRTTPQVTTEQQHSWSLVARWDFPVGGEQQARIAESRLRAQAAQEEAQRVANALSSELASLGPRIAETANNVARLERQIRQYDLLVQAGELQFEAGRRTVAQLIQLREGRFTAEQRRAEQAHRHLTARLRQLALNGALLPALGLPDAEVPPAR